MLLEVKQKNRITGKTEIIGKVKFEDNLTLQGEPAYMNEGGEIGLVRGEKGRLRKKLVFMYKDNFYPSSSFAFVISEDEAYEICRIRGRYSVIDKLDICAD